MRNSVSVLQRSLRKANTKLSDTQSKIRRPLVTVVYRIYTVMIKRLATYFGAVGTWSTWSQIANTRFGIYLNSIEYVTVNRTNIMKTISCHSNDIQPLVKSLSSCSYDEYNIKEFALYKIFAICLSFRFCCPYFQLHLKVTEVLAKTETIFEKTKFAT